MTNFYVSWVVSGVVIVAAAIGLSWSIGRGAFGFLIDNRGRYSLTQFQLFLWTFAIVSLFVALFFARLLGGVSNALDFSIPSELLAVLGISVGSTVTATVVKTSKDLSPRAAAIAASRSSGGTADYPRFAQMFLVEEGSAADQTVDVTKFQNFWFTLLLVSAYIALVVNGVNAAKTIGAFTLPGFSSQFVTLLGISHAAYIAGKIPTRAGDAPGLTMAGLNPPPPAPGVAAVAPAAFQPRNPNRRAVANLGM